MRKGRSRVLYVEHEERLAQAQGLLLGWTAVRKRREGSLGARSIVESGSETWSDALLIRDACPTIFLQILFVFLSYFDPCLFTTLAMQASDNRNVNCRLCESEEELLEVTLS